jgi:tetratricopeptide (TPR) repeat protein
MLRDVRFRRMGARVAEKTAMISARTLNHRPPVRFFLLAFTAIILGGPARAGSLTVPPEARQGLDVLYRGDPDAAIQMFRGIEAAQPDHPLGYLLELEARWWKMYCQACDVKWGLIDVWKKSKRPEDQQFFALAEKATNLAKAQLAKSETAEMHLYAGIGLAMRARLYGLRDEHRATARAGVAAREEFLRVTQLDPDMADAYAGLGLYNYYVDTLSGLVKFLRFFLGIPGGSKKEGIQQLELAMEKGQLMNVEARFYLAKNLRTYDQRYERAEEVLSPLVQRYPRNPIFLLLQGNLNAELGRPEKAKEAFRAAQAIVCPDSVCDARVHQIAKSFLDSLH